MNKVRDDLISMMKGILKEPPEFFTDIDILDLEYICDINKNVLGCVLTITS